MTRFLIILLIFVLVTGVQANNLLRDSVWTFKAHDEHHDVEQNEIWLSADRPGEGTGSEVLNKGFIQCETGIECLHTLGTHLLTMPTTLFRFGLHKRVELRLEYTGTMMVLDHPDIAPTTPDEHLYILAPLEVGAKILLWDHHGGSLDKAWIPRAAVLCNLGLPISNSLAKDLPLSGSVDLLFENEITEWLSFGYDVGVQWNEWAPAPDIFASLSVNFEPTNHLGLFIESFNLFDPDAIDLNTGKTYTHCHINLDFGITYAVHPRVQLDAYAGFNIYNSGPIMSFPKNYAFWGFGATWLIWHPK
ncbi:MAG: transporter [Paludibacteraceae bacterium]|nr:transporter [Paludibacteraceae bacterium]